ncbi:MAG: tyrosine-type recombinase/integrase [Acidobacteria bacterium]|nr:tyrosine-type recombinase/integrase [Acidobacteriota bacterium]
MVIETGVRPKEYLGLQWKDIDFENKVLSVRRALVVKKGGGLIFTELKTKKSRRSIPISNGNLVIVSGRKSKDSFRTIRTRQHRFNARHLQPRFAVNAKRCD